MLSLHAVLEERLTEIDQVDLICFDVFDTVLTRVLGEPSALFLALGQTLQSQNVIPVTAEFFARARRSAEGRIRGVTSPGKDVTLVQIYEELGRFYPWASRIQGVLTEAEMQEERAAIRPVPGMVELLASLRERPIRIAFVSDMYLPTEFLRERLLAYGLAHAEDGVFVSSDCGSKKGNNGALLEHVLDELNTRPRRALHVGNDWMVDYMAARRVGMHALYVPDANCSHFEAILGHGHWETGGIASLYAGAARIARLELVSQEDVDETLLPVCTAVVAPLVFSYTLWVLKSAIDLGLRKLYFLAREGEVVYRVAETLIKHLNIPIQAHYLYVSRQSLNLAMLDDPNEVELQWALTNFENDSVYELLGRVGLSPHTIQNELSAMSIDEETWHSRVRPEMWSRLLMTLVSQGVRDEISQQARKRNAIVRQYLEGETFFEDVPIGLVDTTGVGSQFRALDRIRVQNKCQSIEGFLMARIWQPRLSYADFPRVHSYYLDQYTYQRHYYVAGLTSMLEVFCAAEHGTVSGYEAVGDRIEPILREGENHQQRQAYTKSIRRAVAQFTSTAITLPDLLVEHADTRSVVLETFSDFWNRPLPSDAAAWGGYPVEAAKSGRRVPTVLAPPLGFFDLWRIQFKDPAATFLGSHAWRAGAEQRSRWYIRSLILTMRTAKKMLRNFLDACPSRVSLFFKVK